MDDSSLWGVYSLILGGTDRSVKLFTEEYYYDEERDIRSIIVMLEGTDGDEPAILRNIAPGIYENDAATVGQLNEAISEAIGSAIGGSY